MSYVLDGITIDDSRSARARTGLSQGAVGAFVMATLWCAVSHLTREDPFLPFRAIAASVLGNPNDNDPRRISVAITLGLLIHFALGMMLGHGLEQAAHRLPSHKAPRGGLFLAATGLGIGLSMGILDRLAPAFASSLSTPAFIAAHALFGLVVETKALRDERRELAAATLYSSFFGTNSDGSSEPSPKK